MIIVGVLISFLLHAIIPFSLNDHLRLYDFLISIIITVLVWEGNLKIDNWMNQSFSWILNPGKRILFHLPVSLLFSVFAIYFPMLFFDKYICKHPLINKVALESSSIVVGILITLIILSIEISSQFFSYWKASMFEAEKYKTESVKAQLQNLKNQINPHFLFNNLSVLSSLVYKDQDKAVSFINQLSKVYRYLLDNRNNELIILDEELTFVNSYNYLLQIRFDTNIVLKIDIHEKYLNTLIAPMVLQMLIENAIKHNEISSEKPLIIAVSVFENHLVVANNLQLRINNEVSTKTGLQNIKDRYKYFTDKDIEVIQNQNLFTVKIPLIKS